jgi:SAM-dependent methyltransferase
VPGSVAGLAAALEADLGPIYTAVDGVYTADPRIVPQARHLPEIAYDEMLELARENATAAQATNVEFIKGHIEDIPLPDASVDVIISNCVINLSGDKRRVIQEAFRVLTPGGRFAVSDVLVRGELPAAVRASMGLWTGCIAGALDESVMQEYLREAGFTDIDIEPTRVYSRDDCAAMIEGTGVDVAHADAVDGRVMSAFIRAVKPAEPVMSTAP